MFRIIIMLIILAGTPGLLAAQSEFVDINENVFGVCGSYSKGTRGTHVGGLDIGFSINGRLDFGFSIQAVFYDDNYRPWLGSHDDKIAQGAYIDYYPLKQHGGKMPFSLAIGVSGLVDERNESATLSAALMRYFPLSQNIRILPIVSGSYIVNDYEDGSVFQVSLPISVRFGGGFMMLAGPSLIINEDYNAVGISLGILTKLH